MNASFKVLFEPLAQFERAMNAHTNDPYKLFWDIMMNGGGAIVNKEYKEAEVIAHKLNQFGFKTHIEILKGIMNGSADVRIWVPDTEMAETLYEDEEFI